MAGTRSAMIQDWFVGPGGSEQVSAEVARLLPGSDVYTTFVDPWNRDSLAGHRVRTWPLQRLDPARRRYRSFLPLYPLWFEALDLQRFDLVVSISSAFAKGVRTHPRATHVAYIHAPMRYAWDLDSYLEGSSFGPLSRGAARVLGPWLRAWDRRAARRPDVLVANSNAVRERIRRYWGEKSELIHPPANLDDIRVSEEDEGYLLVVARLVAYRRIDLLVDFASRLGRQAVIVGDGPDLQRLRQKAGPSITFRGRLERDAVVRLLERCHAYVVPGEEDFGIAPVEAMAAGKPVIAYRKGGALDTVVEGTTGVFFDRQTVDALAEAVERSDSIAFDASAIRRNAERFAAPAFRHSFVQLFESLGIDPALYRHDVSEPS